MSEQRSKQEDAFEEYSLAYGNWWDECAHIQNHSMRARRRDETDPGRDYSQLAQLGILSVPDTLSVTALQCCVESIDAELPERPEPPEGYEEYKAQRWSELLPPDYSDPSIPVPGFLPE